MLVISESMVLSFLGGGIGLFLAGLSIKVLTESQLLIDILPNLTMNLIVAAQALVCMAIFGFITGITPAINTLRKPINECFSKG